MSTSTPEWVSSDNEIWSYDTNDNFIWLPGIIAAFANYIAICQANGKINSGVIANLQTDDDSKIIFDEMNRTPGFCYLFRVHGVEDIGIEYKLNLKASYGGDDAHTVNVEIYNWITQTYTHLTTLANSTLIEDYELVLPTDSDYFYDSDTMWFRIIHTDAGNDGHLLRISYMVVETND